MAFVTSNAPSPVASFNGEIHSANDTTLVIREIGGLPTPLIQTFSGVGFTYSDSGTSVTGGTVTRVQLTSGALTYYDITGLNLSAVTVAGFVTSGNGEGLSAFLLGGNDTIQYLSNIGAAIFGYAGNDNITAKDGDDTLVGGQGDDTMRAGAGNDTYLVDSSGDVVDETGGSGTDTLISSVSQVLGSGIEHLELSDFSDLNGTGNSLHNRLVGNSGANVLSGEGGNDTLDGGFGADQMTGGSGNDSYYVDDLQDTVAEQAGGGQDTVFAFVSWQLGNELEALVLSGANAINGTGNALDNTISGNDADNLLDGGTGADTLVGNGGNDTFIVDNAGDVLQDSAGTDTVRSSLATTTLASGFEHLELQGGAVSGTGNTGANRITGNSGNNTLTGAGGDDTLDGGVGNDVLTGGTGNDSYYIDTLQDSISDSGGVDRVYSAASGYVLGSGLEHLTLTGTALSGTGNTLANQITGNSSNNLLDGAAGDDTLDGGAGDDTYVADDAGDVLLDTSGNDTVRTSRSGFMLAGGFENLELTGSAVAGTGNSAANRLTGNSANNTLTGAGGNDTLDGGAGIDTLVGGSGYDTYVVDALQDVVQDSGGYDVLISHVDDYLFASHFDELRLAGGALLATGNSADNLITGTAAGNRLDGGAGADTLVGGQGDDIYIVDQAGDLPQEQASEGSDEVRASLSWVLAEPIEHLTLTGTDGIHGTGNSAANRITGNSGGNILDGGLGADTLEGLGGNDIYWVDNAGDVVIEVAGGGSNDTVRSVGVSVSLEGIDIESMLMESNLVRENSFSGTGNALDNTITAVSTGRVTLHGGSGQDVLEVAALLDGSELWGEAGNDQLQGSFRADSLDGGADSDTLRGGDGNDMLHGGTGSDTLAGDGGDDRLDGGDDNDVLLLQHSYAISDERFGRATVTGGAGADQFHYRTPPGHYLQNFTMPGVGFSSVAAPDRITDFQPAQGDLLVTGINNGQGGEFNTRALVWLGAADAAFQASLGQSLALAGYEGANPRFLGFWTVADTANSRTVLYMDTDRNGVVSGQDLRIDFDGTVALAPESFSAGTFVLQTGSAGADADTRIPMGALADNAFGLGGNDTLDGLAGNDSVSGDRGDDQLAGSAGNDRLFGGEGQDTLNGGDDHDSLYGGTGNDTLAGGEGDDELWADGFQDGTGFQFTYVNDAEDGSNHLSGGVGSDFLLGSAGTDTLLGEVGDDVLAGGDGADSLDGGDGHDTLQGGAGRDTLQGGDGNDQLEVGEEGNARGSQPDLLGGGSGNDRLVFNPFGSGLATGGSGADHFNFFGSFSTAASSSFSPVAAPDRITDFDAAGGDRIGLGFSQGLSVHGGGPVVWRGAAAEGFTATAGQSVSLAGTPVGIPYYLDVWMVALPASGLTVVYLDRNADGLVDANDLRIELSGSLALDSSSFASGSFSIAGTPQADSTTQLPGSAGNDALFGLDGNDTLSGLGGDDRIFGNQGDDWLNGGSDQDRLYGGSGNDLLQGLGGSDFLLGGTGNDTLEGGEGDDFLYAATVNNTDFDGVADAPGSSNRMLGGSGNDLVVGDEGNDLLAGGPGDDTLMGQAGLDTADYEDATEAVVVNLNHQGAQFVGAGQGNDVLINIENLLGGTFNDVLIGDSDPNQLAGSGGNDTLDGGEGHDTLLGGAGNDDLNGGDGDDTVFYADAGEGVTVDLARAGLQFISTSRGSDQLVSIENITGSAHSDVLIGSTGANQLDGGGGSDRLTGGAGDDTYHVDTQSDLVFENLDGGIDTILSTVSFYLYAHVEGLVLQGGSANLFGSGNDRDNTLTGNDGNNLLLGWDGNDTIAGNAGNDNLYGVEGADSLLGGADIDNLIGGNGSDTLDGGSEPDALYGEGNDDVLYGGTGFFTDILIGGAGNDTLDGSASVASGLTRNQGDYDRMNGGAGNDTYYVDTPSDLTFEALNDGTDTVIADINGAGYYLYANVENLTLTGNTPFGVGNELTNTLTGSELANWLLGGAGNDTINGGGGNDVLFGEGGADTFVFRRGTGGDLIGDFTPGTDRIDIAGIGYSSFAQVQARMVQNGGSTAIDLGQGDFVVLVGVSLASLGAADIILA
jgi:Ca2+-binding RTX toxin-like protein